MTRDELIGHIDRLLGKYRPLAQQQHANPGNVISESGVRAEAEEFLKNFAGPESAFYKTIAGWSGWWSYDGVTSVLARFREYVAAGLMDAVSPERQAQFDVVSDLLDQAGALLADSSVHPGAAAMLIGATLEEYLRAWVARLGLTLGQRKPGIQTYVETLRDAAAITKQDVKTLIAWAGLRNQAAHGEWDQVDNRKEIRLMLEGVNLFMQRYGA